MSTELEIIPAEAATKLEAIKQNITVYNRGIEKSMAGVEAYAYLSGLELLNARATIPHGNKDANAGLMKWVEANFTDFSYKTATRRMAFAEKVQEKLDTVSNFKTNTLLLPSGEVSPDAEKALTEAVKEVMDGKSMTEFLRGEGYVREPKQAEHKPAAPVSPDEQLAIEKEEQSRMLKTHIGDTQTRITKNPGLIHATDKDMKAVIAANIAANARLRDQIKANKAERKTKKGAK